MTILHAGGKFDNSAYKVSGGLHGVGVSVVNALPQKMNVRVRRDGKVYEMEFSRGKTTQKMREIGTSSTTGTTVTFWPDDEIFETTVYDFDILHDRLQQTAFLNSAPPVRPVPPSPSGRMTRSSRPPSTTSTSCTTVCSRRRSSTRTSRSSCATSVRWSPRSRSSATPAASSTSSSS